jgi:hypothetical protein
MKTQAVYHGFDIETEVVEVDGPTAVATFTITATDEHLVERMRKAYQPLATTLPLQTLNAPAGVDMNTWPSEHLIELAQRRIDEILNDLPR